MPTTKKTLKELRETLKALQTTTRTLETASRKDREEPAVIQYYRGRADGIEAARKLVEQLCQ